MHASYAGYDEHAKTYAKGVLMAQALLFDVEVQKTHEVDLNRPSGYRGLAAFHKYWGKKPVECMAYLIENLTSENEVILDPFVGSGLVAREALQRNRRFIGIDINPVAIELSRLIVNPPSYNEFSRAIEEMRAHVKPNIDRTYMLANGDVATHFLWEENELKSIWWVNGRWRQEYEPTEHDVILFHKYSSYTSKHVRDLKFFTNSRINASPHMTIEDLFTGRALHNIDAILGFIRRQPEKIKKALLLTLTSASGQMSKMVFAVSKRGKTTGKVKEQISVGSWVIGYWRPKLHFEINVWKCFENRARKLMQAIKEMGLQNGREIGSTCSDVIESRFQVALLEDDARTVLEKLPKESVSLVLTDPPHSDRVPYLELSELWNAILEKKVRFDREIVVSNARERNKGKGAYTRQMQDFFADAAGVLRAGGIMAILFNASDGESWEYLRTLQTKSDSMRFRGCFPMAYSAGSVVQDNRKGALKYDYVLIYEKCSGIPDGESRWKKLGELDNWSSSLPTKDK
jgi:16S rRNA G966 N2-methylase RsmD